MRTLLFDTDVLLLISGLDCFDTTLDLLEVERPQVYTLAAVPHIVKSPKLQRHYGEQTIARVQQILPDLQTLASVSAADQRILRVLALVEEIDPGEALLIAKTINMPDAILLSGDKRWMRSLCKSRVKAVVLIKKQLHGTVVSFEHVLQALLARVGFAELATAVAKSKLPHLTLRVLFPQDVKEPENDCREGLLAYLGKLEATAGREFFYRF